MRFKTIGFVLLLLAVMTLEWQSAEAHNRIELSLLAAVVEMDNHEGFFQYEVLVNYELPLRRQWDSGWTVRSMLDSAFGTISATGETLVVGSVGPSFSIGKTEGLASLNAGVRGSLLSASQFEAEDFGGNFQFILHAGVKFKLNRNLRIGYRFQHMSNARIYSENPGLDLSVIEIGYGF